MTIKIVTLVSGESVIGNLNYLLNENEDIVAYQMEFPCQYDLHEKLFTVSEGKKEIKLSFSPWPKLADNEKVELPLDSLIAVTNPVEELLNKYRQIVLKEEINE